VRSGLSPPDISLAALACGWWLQQSPGTTGHADWYDQVFSAFAAGDDALYVRQALGPGDAGVCLDVACGTGLRTRTVIVRVERTATSVGAASRYDGSSGRPAGIHPDEPPKAPPPEKKRDLLRQQVRCRSSSTSRSIVTTTAIVPRHPVDHLFAGTRRYAVFPPSVTGRPAGSTFRCLEVVAGGTRGPSSNMARSSNRSWCEQQRMNNRLRWPRSTSVRES
jgi:hypothetical protein